MLGQYTGRVGKVRWSHLENSAPEDFLNSLMSSRRDDRLGALACLASLDVQHS
jgi:hypothetical protein